MLPPPSRSPLLVFLLLGIGVLAFEHWLNGGNSEQRVVTVTAEQVDALRARWDAQWGRPPSDRELQGLIDEAVPGRDPLSRGVAAVAGPRRPDRAAPAGPEDEVHAGGQCRAAELPAPAAHEVEAYFAAHTERYRDPDRTTFRHVYLSADRRADPRRDATALLREVRAGEEGGWRRAGDPFVLLREYADRTDRDIANLFGMGFAATLRGIEAGDWQGPIASAHGVHLVRVLDRRSPSPPALDDVRERVVQDPLEAQRREQNRAALQALRERYDVRMAGSEPLGERP